eukprot:2259514-Amphidinium_carterae.1
MVKKWGKMEKKGRGGYFQRNKQSVYANHTKASDKKMQHTCRLALRPPYSGNQSCVRPAPY